MKLFKLLPALLLLAIVGAFSPAQAQISQGVRVCNPDQATWCLKPLANGSSPSGLVANFVATSQAKLSVTTATSRLALPTADPTVVLNNTGSVPVYFRFGNTTVNAGLGDIYLGAGSTVTLSPGPYGFVAAITASGSATVQVTMGQGVPYFVGGGGSGGGGGGGAVTIADGADVTEGGTIDAATTAGGIGTVSSKLRLLTSQADTSNASLGTLAGTVSGGNINVACITGCSGGGGSGYSVLNTGAYANSTSYSNVPSGGLVATSAPTYTTGQASPISLTTGGNLRVADSAVASVLGSPFQAGGSIGNTSFAATQSGTWNITNVSGTISLPTGASTSALQTTGNTSLASIAAAASGSNLNVICTSGCSGGGGSGYSVLNTSTYTNSTSFSNVPSGGLVATSAPTYTTGQASPVSLTTGGALRVDGSAATQPVSGTVACSNCSGTSYSVLNASTYANSSSFSNVPSGGLVSTSAPTYTTGQASPLNLNTAGALRTDGSGVTQPISASALPLPSGAATAANQSTVISTLGSPFQAGGSIGNTAFGATQSGTWNVTNVSGTVSLPTGAATSALQTTGNTSVGNIDTNAGATADAAATAGSTGTMSAKLRLMTTQLATLGTNTTSIATSALQTTGNTSLATIATNTTNAGAPAVATDTSGNVHIVQAAASAAINVSTATTTQLFALSSGKKIYVLAANVIAGGTGNITFVYGTGTNCGTGTTSLTGAYPLTAQNGIAMGSGLGPILVVPASNALCVTTSAAVQMSGSVAVAQF